MSINDDALAAYETHKDAALDAFMIYRGYCEGREPPRVSGMSTSVRLAYRISLGRTVEEAAAREYAYRWFLAIKAPDQCNATGKRSYEPRDRNPRACISIFGTPHTLGM